MRSGVKVKSAWDCGSRLASASKSARTAEDTMAATGWRTVVSGGSRCHYARLIFCIFSRDEFSPC